MTWGDQLHSWLHDGEDLCVPCACRHMNIQTHTQYHASNVGLQPFQFLDINIIKIEYLYMCTIQYINSKNKFIFWRSLIKCFHSYPGVRVVEFSFLSFTPFSVSSCRDSLGVCDLIHSPLAIRLLLLLPLLPPANLLTAQPSTQSCTPTYDGIPIFCCRHTQYDNTELKYVNI